MINMKNETLEKQEFDSILSMISSRDHENWTVGLTIMENLELTDYNVINILLVLKQGIVADKHIKTNYQTFYDNLTNAVKDYLDNDFRPNISHLTYKQLFKIVNEGKFDYEAKQSLIDSFSMDFKNKLIDTGYTFIEDVIIKIKDER